MRSRLRVSMFVVNSAHPLDALDSIRGLSRFSRKFDDGETA